MSSSPLDTIALGIATQGAQIQILMEMAISTDADGREAYVELARGLQAKGECTTWEELVARTVEIMKYYRLGWWKRAGFLTHIEIAMGNLGITPGAIKDYKNAVHLLVKTAL